MSLFQDTLNSFLKIKSITDGFVQQAVTASPFLDIMKKGKAFVTKMGGDYVKVGLEYALNTSFAAWDGEGAITLPTKGQYLSEFVTEGRYKWGYHVAQDLITYKQYMEQEKAEDSIESFAKSRLSNMADAIGRSMETNLFTAYNGSTYTAFGIPDIVRATNPANYATYGLGDIDIGDMPLWKSDIDIYTSAQTLARQMFHMINSLAYNYGTPDLIVTTQDVFEIFADEAYQKAGYLVRDEIPLKLGFQTGGSFNAIPVVYSDKCTSGYMYFLNTKYLKLVVHPEANFKSTGWQQVATNNLDLLALTTLTYNLVCSNRAAQGALTGIS